MSPVRFLFSVFVLLSATAVPAQQPPYDVVPAVEPPYYRVRYEASSASGELDLAVQYALWIPPGIERLRGVVVHQHGCGEGSCKSGLTGAFDLHWQALAARHHCALLAASYEQPTDADCQRWCDPRNGSDVTFQRSLVDLGKVSGHLELADVPWALWGHSGGATWSGTMTLLYPDRVAATWLRSGVPLTSPRLDRPSAKIVAIPAITLAVPLMINLGTEEGVTVTDGRFAGVWPAAKSFFQALRNTGSPVGIAIDPLTGHQCGNQRYLAIPWFDECLSARLPIEPGAPLRPIPQDQSWLATLADSHVYPVSEFPGQASESIWLPSKRIAQAWTQYIKDTQVTDTSPPPAPESLHVIDGELTWDAQADLESGIQHFIIERNGMQIATVPEVGKNPFGRPLFQGLQYSDTPIQPLIKMQFRDPAWKSAANDHYQIRTVNTVGLESINSTPASRANITAGR